MIDTGGMTRGIAPCSWATRLSTRKLNIAGVILNKVGGPATRTKLRAAVRTCDAFRRRRRAPAHEVSEIGERHLGLTTPGETGEFQKTIREIAQIVSTSVDLDLLLTLASHAPALADPPRSSQPAADVTIAIARDRAFGFYYPDDLEAFAEAGAQLRAVRRDERTCPAGVRRAVPRRRFPGDVRRRARRQHHAQGRHPREDRAGLPAYAECGGLARLARTIRNGADFSQMVGVVAADAVMHPRPRDAATSR
ncbi:MAG: hypothetical protein R3D80_01580 [Paracoccaceae bacterium]